MPLMKNYLGKLVEVNDDLVRDCLLKGFKLIGDITEAANLDINIVLKTKRRVEREIKSRLEVNKWTM